MITLTPSNDLFLRADQIVRAVREKIAGELAEAEIEHIGATAIPGAMTKGDVDVMVRVSPAAFARSVEVLKKAFSVKQPKNWDPNFASFGDETGYDLPLGVQLVIRDSEADFFVFMREYLIKNEAALVEYNRLKIQHAELGPEAYWKAKNNFLTKILAARST